MKKILFICVENRARSQMAEGLARHFVGHQYDFFSAGSQPATRVHPMAVAVMGEIGIDITHQQPKSISDIDLNKMDLIITLCTEEACPILPANIKRQDWSLTDPAADSEDEAAQLKRFRKIRDAIRQKVLTLRAADQSW